MVNYLYEVIITNKDYLVTKSNYFIMNCNYDLSLEEQKLILTLSSMVQPTDEEFKPYTFKIAEFIELLGVENQAKYTEIPKITKELMKKVFEIQEGNTLLQVAWLSSARYEKGSGMVTLKFSPDLKPYMLQLKEKFTQYQLGNILSMKSKYSPRIYEILKCNEFKKQGYIEIEIVDLRNLLKAEDIYPRYNDFKRKVIEQSQKELKKNSDIDFDFEEIKTGRRVTSLKFYIHANKTKKVNAPKVADEVSADHEETPLDTLEQRINQTLEILEYKKNKVNPSEALSIIGSINGDMDILKKTYEYCKDKQTDNFVGYIIKIAKSIKDGSFNEPKKSYKKTGFNNFEPRKQSERYIYLQEQCLIGQATEEERKEFNKMRGEE